MYLRQKQTIRNMVLPGSILVMLVTAGLIIFFNLDSVKSRAEGNGDYRTVRSGNWSDIAIWEKYNGSWASASTAPTSADKTITIRSGDTVTVATDLSTDQVIVNKGGCVMVNKKVTLTVLNGTGTDLLNFGTLQNSGTIIATGALIKHESGGQYLHNYTSYSKLKQADIDGEYSNNSIASDNLRVDADNSDNITSNINISKDDDDYSNSTTTIKNPSRSEVAEIIVIDSVSLNPISDQMNVSFTTPNTDLVKCFLVNTRGKLVSKKEIRPVKGFNSFTSAFNGNLPSGTYYIVLSNGELKATKKIVRN